MFLHDTLTDIDECLDKPCRHGKCENHVRGYTCHCSRGYEGKNCQDGRSFKLIVVEICSNKFDFLPLSKFVISICDENSLFKLIC